MGAVLEIDPKESLSRGKWEETVELHFEHGVFIFCSFYSIREANCLLQVRGCSLNLVEPGNTERAICSLNDFKSRFKTHIHTHTHNGESTDCHSFSSHYGL